MAGCALAAFTSAAYAAEPQATDPDFTALADGIRHPTQGCDGAVVLTPRPGTQFADPLGSHPESATSFFAKAASLHVHWASTVTCTHTGLTHRRLPDPNGPDPDTTVQVQSAYSGYQIDNLSHYVQSGWTVPTVVNPPIGYRYSTTGYASSTWAGMGGGHYHYTSDLPLIQAGTTQKLSASNVATYYFWYEIVGGSDDTYDEVRPVGAPAAHAGDDVGTVSIWFHDGSTEFGLCNFSSGGCVNFLRDCLMGGHCSEEPGAATTEWIVERPGGYGAAPLADFGEVNFYNGFWCSDYVEGEPVDCHAISVPGLTSLTAYHLREYVFGSYQILAEPGGITSGNSFTDIYNLPDNHQ
ncbi:MAG: G1 family glutamic endopeptidase [Rhodanobacteraceae bacterium]